MRSKYLFIFLILATSTLLFNCSEVQDEITQAPILEGVHPDGFGKLGSDNFHSFKLQSSNWDLEACQKCHASDYSGGTVGVSCNNCHSSEEGPEACNTCHGVFADESRIAPPNDLANNMETSAKGVGAHTAHVYENTLSLGIGCYDCHSGDIGEGNYVESHIDGLPAEMSLASGTYSSSSLTCSDTYCHGNFSFSKSESNRSWAYADDADAISGNNFTPIWTTVDGTQSACGTCHGTIVDGIANPLPAGHFNNNNYTIDDCVLCHQTTFNYYNSSEDFELNTFTHANGEKDVDFMN